MSKLVDLKNYIKNNFFDKTLLCCQKCFLENYKDFSFLLDGERNDQNYKIENIEILDVYFEWTGTGYTIIKFKIILLIKSDCVEIRKEAQAVFRVKMDSFKSTYELVRINFIEEKVKENGRYISSKLIPLINEEMLDEYAEIFLEEIYPLALKIPTKLPAETILYKLGLECKYKKLPTNSYGKIYFFDDEKEEKE